MDKSILISGFGGQGVQLMGKLMAYAANEDNLNVTYYPSYGKEMRGGTSHCTVVISDRSIGAPARAKLDYVVAFNQSSVDAFAKRLNSDGIMFFNSSLCKDPKELYGINAEGVALNVLADELGSPLLLNIIMLGYFVRRTGVVSVDSALRVVENTLGKNPKMMELNRSAFSKGVALADCVQ